MKRVVLVGCRFMEDGYLKAAADRGWQLGLVETAERIEEIEQRFPGLLVDTEAIDWSHYKCEEAWLPLASALVERMAPDGVLGRTEENVLAASLLQDARQLPGLGLLAGQVGRNKALQRVMFQRYGLRQPDFHLTPRLSEATDWAGARLPVVVKPLSQSGSLGVEYLADDSDWTAALRRRGHEGPLLVEEYVDGAQYSWEALVRDGTVVFSNLTRTERTKPPHLVCVLHEVGFGAERPEIGATADDIGAGVVEAMRMGTGLIHLELLERPDGKLVVVEVATRNPGAFLVEIMSRSYEVDLFAAYLDAAVGGRPQLAPASCVARPSRYGALVKFAVDRAGCLRSARLDGLDAVPGMVRYDLRMELGTPVRPPQCVGDFVGYAILDCASRAQCRESILQAQAEAVFAVE